MADASATIEPEVAIKADNKTEAVSREYIKQRLMAFAEGVGPGKITNPLDQTRFMVKEVLQPAFGSKLVEKSIEGASIFGVEVREQVELEKFKNCAVFFVKMARTSEGTVAVDCLVDVAGKIIDYPQNNTDSIVIPVNEQNGGKNGRDNYINIILFWEGQGAVASPKQGSGDSLTKDLNALKERLENRNSKLLLASINFMSRQKTPSVKTGSSLDA